MIHIYLMSYGAVQFAKQVAKHKYSHTKKKTDDATMQKNAKILERDWFRLKPSLAKNVKRSFDVSVRNWW